jgi:Stress responsive A/B Barrel Domain
MVRHSVILKLKAELTSEEVIEFFQAVDTLKSIPDVQKFEVLKQTSPKNKFEFGISMEFDHQAKYEVYSSHALHQAFIQKYWVKSVDDFLEIDYEFL